MTKIPSLNTSWAFAHNGSRRAVDTLFQANNIESGPCRPTFGARRRVLETPQGDMEFYSKFKESMPEETIGRVRRLLDGIGAVVIEEWIHGLKDVFSVRISLPGTTVGANGKGTSQLYALASAYGEFVERLQNGRLYRDAWPPSEIFGSGGFRRAPDETRRSMDDILRDPDPVTAALLDEQSLLRRAGPGDRAGMAIAAMSGMESTTPVLLSLWAEIEPDGAEGGILCLPFYSLRRRATVLVPERMAWCVYSTNGMAAGNTMEEAAVQGLSEICERHVNREILLRREGLPDIPAEWLEPYPSLLSIIAGIESGGRYRVLLKDGTLNEGWPVALAILIDVEGRSYFPKAGAHPSFPVALERCLTEMAQGRDLLNETLPRGFLTPFPAGDESAARGWNLHNIQTAGIGPYPAELFSSSLSRPSPWPGIGTDNASMLRYLAGRILAMGYDVLVRDVSVLGLPSVQVIVPGLSETLLPGREELGRQAWLFKTRRGLACLADLTEDETRSLCRFLTYQSALVGWKGLSPVCDDGVLTAAALFRLGRFAGAAGRVESVIARSGRRGGGKDGPDARSGAHLRCLRDMLRLKARQWREEDIVSSLGVFYPHEMVDRLISEWRDPETPLARLIEADREASGVREGRDGDRAGLAQLHERFQARQANRLPDWQAVARCFELCDELRLKD